MFLAQVLRKHYWLLALLWLPCTASTADWMSAETDEFSVIGDANPQEIRRVLESIQVFRYVAGKFYPLLLKPAPYKAQIFVLRRPTFAKYLRQGDNVAGFVHVGDFAMDIVVEANSDQDWLGSRAIVQHELTHFYLRLNYKRYLPVWYDEGLAEFLSTIDFKGKRARIGVIPQIRDYTLKNSEWLPLERLFAVGRSSSEYHSHRLAAAFYAQSWLLVHYGLMSGDAKAAAYYERMVRGLEINLDLPQVLDLAFTGQLAEFERQMRSYGAGNLKLFGYFDAPPAALRVPELQKIDTVLATSEFADLIVRLGNRSGAELDRDVGELLPAPVGARAAGVRALAYLANKNIDGAAQLLDLCRHTAADYPSLLACARAWTAKTEFSRNSDERTAIELTVLELAKRAFDANPSGFAALYQQIDMISRLGRTERELLPILETALEKLPSSFALRMALANAYGMAGNFEASRKHLEYLLLYEREPALRDSALRAVRHLENQIADRSK